jgi:hypothetical protein
MIRLINPDKLAEYGIRLGDRQRRRLEQAGEFPRRVATSKRSHGYVESEVADYLESKIAGRPRTQIAARNGTSESRVSGVLGPANNATPTTSVKIPARRPG